MLARREEALPWYSLLIPWSNRSCSGGLANRTESQPSVGKEAGYAKKNATSGHNDDKLNQGCPIDTGRRGYRHKSKRVGSSVVEQGIAVNQIQPQPIPRSRVRLTLGPLSFCRNLLFFCRKCVSILAKLLAPIVLLFVSELRMWSRVVMRSHTSIRMRSAPISICVHL